MSETDTLPLVCFECTDEMVPENEEVLREFVRVKLEDETSDFRTLIERLLQHQNKANQTEMTVGEALDISNGAPVKSLAEVRTVNEVVRKAARLVQVQLAPAAAEDVFSHRNVPQLNLVKIFTSSEHLLMLTPLINTFLAQKDKLSWLKDLPLGRGEGSAGAFVAELMNNVYQGDKPFSYNLFLAHPNCISESAWRKVISGEKAFSEFSDWQVEKIIDFIAGFTHCQAPAVEN